MTRETPAHRTHSSFRNTKEICQEETDQVPLYITTSFEAETTTPDPDTPCTCTIWRTVGC